MELTTNRIKREERSGIVELTLVSPGGRNALTPDLITELTAQLVALPADCRAVVLQGGDVFCSGFDLGSLTDHTPEDLWQWAEAFHTCLEHIRLSPIPVIAAVSGEVQGGGLGLLCACDLVIAGPNASFQLPEVVVGMIPALIAPYLLRRLSPGRAQALTVSSRRLGASEAHTWGLIDEVAEALDDAVTRQIKRLQRSSPEAVTESKRLFIAESGQDLSDRLGAARGRFVPWVTDEGRQQIWQDFAAGGLPPWFAR